MIDVLSAIVIAAGLTIAIVSASICISFICVIAFDKLRRKHAFDTTESDRETGIGA